MREAIDCAAHTALYKCFSKSECLLQIEYLMSKARDVKIRGRLDFEEDFDEIKDIISAKTMFKTDDHIQRMEEVRARVIARLELLRERAAEQEDSIDEASIVDLAAR